MDSLWRFGSRSVETLGRVGGAATKVYPNLRHRISRRLLPDITPDQVEVTSCRTMFLSDLHLGAVGARADFALRLLRSTRADTYILVGDILDLWQPGPVQWGDDERAIIAFLRTRFREGAKIVYVCGNHDPDAQAIAATGLLPVPAVKRYQHTTASGATYLIVHGDDADSAIGRSAFLTRLGSWTDRYLRLLDGRFDRPEHGGRTPIEALIAITNWALHRRGLHEAKLVEQAQQDGCDGVICGHFHRADLHSRFGLTYANCGDWFDSFTALSEDHTGQLRLLGGRAYHAAEAVSDFQIEGLAA